MSRLLNKPLKVFAIYAVLILACSIPVYYFIINAIWLEELDEHNFIVKEQTQTGFNKLDQRKEELEKSIFALSKVQPGVLISPVESWFKDSTYTIRREMNHSGEIENDRFRGLISCIQIDGRLFRITVETNVEEADETVLAIALITCVFIALLITGFILLNKRLSKKVWEPFTDTLERLKHFDLNTSSHIDFKSTDIKEFIELNETLGRLIAANIVAYKHQKEFVQNASHELQTPLALLKTKIDLLIQDNSLTEKQRETIESLAESVSRVSRINRNLLLLAGIENRAYTAQEIFVNDRVELFLNSFLESSGGGREINRDFDAQVYVVANETLIDVLITNLLSNSFRHGSIEAPIKVTIDNRQLIVENGGRVELKHEALFKRFQSASSDSPGTGLGLAIANEICAKYGWDVSYQFEKGTHRFTVTF